jgi:hypothetical protein
MFIFLLPVLLLETVTGSGPSEIAQWRGPSRDGIYPEKNLLSSWPSEGPKLLWKFENLGKGYSSAAVTSDYVITAGCIDSTLVIFCFNHSGKSLWQQKMGPEWCGDFPGTGCSVRPEETPPT